MRAVVLAIVVSATGCMSVSLGGGVNLPLHGPSRVVDGQYGFGTYIGIKDTVVVEPSFQVAVGPLGEKSEPVLAFGARVLTHSHRWTPGYFGMFTAAGSATDSNHPDRDIIARQYRIGGGISWDTHKYQKPDDDPWFYDSYGVIALGVVYTHQSQDSIGSGDFMGIELTLTGGFSIQGLFHSLANADLDP